MTSQSFTEQERTDIIQGLSTLIKRSRNKITNDEFHGRHDYNRIAWRKEKIERVKLLIEKFTNNGEEETHNADGERRLQTCS